MFVWFVSGGAAAAQSLSSVPPGWSDLDIGAPAIAGATLSSGDVFQIRAGGADIWGAADQFHFVYRAVSGDVDVRARIDAVTAAAPWSKAGVMIRSSLGADAAHAYALASAGKGVAFQRRLTPGGGSLNTAGEAAAPPRWVRLVRSGGTVTAFSSLDGTAWTLIASDTIQLGSTVYVGLAVTSHNVSAATVATVSQVGVLTATSPGLPAGQGDGDIGGPAVAGSASLAAGVYTIKASGADIWDAADQFHYVFQRASGDLDIRVRILSIAMADRWSKAGVMIRSSLDPGSPHAFALASAGRGYAFQRRWNSGGLTVNTAGSAAAPPGWVRLTRTGDLITAYQSVDGASWTAIGSDSIPLGQTVYVGIAAVSHAPALLTTVTADRFSVAAASGNQPPSVALSVPATSFGAPATIALTASASDPENQLARVEFYAGQTLLGTDTAAPYQLTWSGVPAGSYSLTAVAIDAQGASTRSAAIPVTVAAAGTPVTLEFQDVDAAGALYFVAEVFRSGTDTSVSAPISQLNLGLPAPGALGLFDVDITTFFYALPAGTYQFTVSAVGSDGSSARSTPAIVTK